MPTRTGDATAELIALLREHCPDIAEETIRRLEEAAGGIDGGPGGGGDGGGDGGGGGAGGGGDGGGGGAGGGGDGGGPGAAGLRWQKLTLGDIPGVSQFVSVAKAPVEVVAALLELVAGILDVVSKLLLAIPDPYRALILAAYQILKDIVDDLLSSGAYVYFDAPGLLTNIATLGEIGAPAPDLPRWVAGDKPKPLDPPADGFENWASRFRQSFDDAGDPDRPIFSDGAPVEAVFVVATAPQIPDLAAFGPLFEKLLNVKAFAKAWEAFAASFPEWPDDPDRARLRTTSVFPDWHSWKLRDIPQLRQLEKVPELLKALLLNVDNVIELLKKLVKAVQDKVALLRQLVDILQQIIDALAALNATGLSVLVVVSDEGVEGLVKAFLEAENRPNTDASGKVQTANAMAGVCFLAGTTELAPVNAAPIWALFGQQRSIEQAYAGLLEDLDELRDQAEAAVADTEALATEAWQGMENGGDDPSGLGLEGLWGGFTGTYEKQREEVLAALGLSQQEADEQAAADRSRLVGGLEQALAEGRRLDPVVLAHVEATRRARRRGRRSLAMSMGMRGEVGAPAEAPPREEG